ncbi:hypothetical protein SY83_13805 [Paenibacillus swuensis]|uniref:DUF559 domain-containing protein n=1 Tax=Paenibacillus swuensis TaxID=1178515 RepID=A0A172TJL4_9BACL|nr:hypothetical protein [Paenibacillus swuensis]ANE47162.1 hypothetical protein SY83_13805 [Paenibacillus swuensis]
MGFTEEHERWLQQHLASRTGERKDRLKRGHAHGERLFCEKVWWPLVGTLEYLHPEYEVADWRGRPYFVDFVWKRGYVNVGLEIKSFGTHVQHRDRSGFRKENNRELYIRGRGVEVLSVSYDEIVENPSLVMSLLQPIFAPLMHRKESEKPFTRNERDTLRLAVRQGGFIRPVDVMNELELGRKSVVLIIQSLCEQGKLSPVNNGARTTKYELNWSEMDSWRI